MEIEPIIREIIQKIHNKLLQLPHVISNEKTLIVNITKKKDGRCHMSNKMLMFPLTNFIQFKLCNKRLARPKKIYRNNMYTIKEGEVYKK